MNRWKLEELKQVVIDVVGDSVPVNTTCPHCEREIDVSCVIDTSAKCHKANWNDLAVNVIKAVVDAIPDLLKEEIE